MAELYTLAHPYAAAAFEQAKEEGQLDRWSDMLHFLAGVVSDEKLASIIAEGRLDGQRLSEFILATAEGKLSDTGTNFVKLLAEHRRYPLLPAISELFERRRAEFEGRQTVQVVSAFDLAPNFQESIAAAMSKRLGRTVDLSMSIDKTLIGGVLVRAGDLVIDATLRGRLKQLGAKLMS